MAPPEKRKRVLSPREEEAEDSSNGLSQEYMAILRALGIENEDRFLASEVQDRVLAAAATIPRPGSTTSSERPSAATRQLQIQAARDEGGLVNPDYEIHGIGEWRWLDGLYDSRVASERFQGLTEPERTVRLRQNGHIPTGTGLDAEPFAVFYPDRSYVNPAMRPPMPGRFHFLTPDADDHARLNFGDQDPYDLGPRPSAESIWNLRREFHRLGEDDRTADIELVFVPGEGSRQPSQEASEPSDAEVDAEDVDLTNGGKYDQTGTADKAQHYQCYDPDAGEMIVIDRSRVTMNLPEPHMFWSYGKKGWKHWRQAKKMDWSDPAMIRKLNNWRDQDLRRGIFKQKRDEARPDYKPEERQWMAAEYKKARAEAPADGWAGLSLRFASRFSERPEKGIQSLWNRVRVEIDRFGALQPRRGRGEHQKEKAAPAPKFALVTMEAGVAQQSKANGKKRERDAEQDDEEGEGEEDGSSEE